MKKADSGDVEAMLDYCATYPEKELLSADAAVRSRVLRYLKTAAKKGNADALCNLGAAYYGSCLVKRDFAKAVKYYEASAAKGCVQAMSNLGYCHYYGRSIPVDYGKAFQWFLKAYIVGGHSLPEACYKLGDCYRNGRGVARDNVIAFNLYEQAYHAAWSPVAGEFPCIHDGWDPRLLGADAAMRLGTCYEEGVGCDKDLRKAIRFYRIAVAGFKRKVELADEFASPLLESAKSRLKEAVDASRGKKRRLPKKFELHCTVAGTSHVDDIEAVAASLHKGYELVLIRDPSNAYDANAVAVATSAGVRFGWIPRSLNAELALRLDKGQSLKATVDFAIPGNGCAEIAISVVNA